jgi:hypothetical protein
MSSAATIPAGLVALGLTDGQRPFVLAQAEIAQCMHDLGLVMLAPPSEAAVARLAGVAAGLDRAANRLRREILRQAPEAAPEPAVVTQEMCEAAHAALEQQAKGELWDDADEVLEGIEWPPILSAALAAPTQQKA